MVNIENQRSQMHYVLFHLERLRLIKVGIDLSTPDPAERLGRARHGNNEPLEVFLIRVLWQTRQLPNSSRLANFSRIDTKHQIQYLWL